MLVRFLLRSSWAFVPQVGYDLPANWKVTGSRKCILPSRHSHLTINIKTNKTCLSADLHKKDKFIQLLDEFIDEDEDEDVQKTKDQCPHRRTSNQVSTHNLVTE